MWLLIRTWDAHKEGVVNRDEHLVEYCVSSSNNPYPLYSCCVMERAGKMGIVCAGGSNGTSFMGAPLQLVEMQ